MRTVLVLAGLLVVSGAPSALAQEPPPPGNTVLCLTVENPTNDRPASEVCVPKPV
jgi:hypothetical protein